MKWTFFLQVWWGWRRSMCISKRPAPSGVCHAASGWSSPQIRYIWPEPGGAAAANEPWAQRLHSPAMPMQSCSNGLWSDVNLQVALFFNTWSLRRGESWLIVILPDDRKLWLNGCSLRCAVLMGLRLLGLWSIKLFKKCLCDLWSTVSTKGLTFRQQECQVEAFLFIVLQCIMLHAVLEVSVTALQLTPM